MSAETTDWNPFGDDNFGELTDDTVFGREFDRLRRGSNSSTCLLEYNLVER